MTNARRTALLIATHVLAIALGAFGAYFYFIRDGIRGMTMLGELSVASMQEMFVNLTRDKGPGAEYEAALQEYLAVLNRLGAENRSGEFAASMSLSKMTVLGRLALAAERRGASPEAKQFIEAATRECVESRRPECSDEKMRELALYLDKGLSSQSAK